MGERENCHYKATYGDSYAKRPPDLTRCCEEVVRYIGNWPHYGQCSRKRGHGPDGGEAARYLKQRMEWAGPRFFAILKQIADGHNDPRSLARDAIAGYVKKGDSDARSENKAAEGRQAYQGGLTRDQNPYPQGSMRYWQWSSGWLDERAFRPIQDKP